MTYDTLQQAFLRYRRQEGMKAAAALFAKHGGSGGMLDTVPETAWPNLAAEFDAATRTTPMAQAQAEPLTLDSIREKAFARFNNPPPVNNG
jgi:hypothetical protein